MIFHRGRNALLEGETEEGLSMLRDLVHPEITFKELAQQTSLAEKTLHRMLGRRDTESSRHRRDIKDLLYPGWRERRLRASIFKTFGSIANSTASE